jgi:hypothetical protein
LYLNGSYIALVHAATALGVAFIITLGLSRCPIFTLTKLTRPLVTDLSPPLWGSFDVFKQITHQQNLMLLIKESFSEAVVGPS